MNILSTKSRNHFNDFIAARTRTFSTRDPMPIVRNCARKYHVLHSRDRKAPFCCKDTSRCLRILIKQMEPIYGRKSDATWVFGDNVRVAWKRLKQFLVWSGPFGGWINWKMSHSFVRINNNNNAENKRVCRRFWGRMVVCQILNDNISISFHLVCARATRTLVFRVHDDEVNWRR